MKKIVLSIITCLLFTISTLFTSSTVSATESFENNTNTCKPAILFLKGSGEGIDEGIPVTPQEYEVNGASNRIIATNGHEGKVLSQLINHFANETSIPNIENTVRFIGIEYDALPVFPEVETYNYMVANPLINTGVPYVLTFADHIIKYYESFTQGAQMIVDTIHEDSKNNNCDTQYMLVGYSQGVISLRLAVNLLGNDTDKIVSTYVVGDPWQRAGSTSPGQRTIANTSPYTDGVGRQGMDILAGLSSVSYSLNLDPSKTQPVLDWGSRIAQSDEVVYKNLTNGIVPKVSRSLCHEYDPTCGFNLTGKNDMEGHLNYFNVETIAGSVDSQFEIDKFDEQVQYLIDSNYESTQDRKLNQTPSVKNQNTIYNLAHYKTGDKCSWDENSDGTIEAPLLDCRKTYSMKSLGGTTKMTVIVTNSYGATFTYSTEDTAAEPEILEEYLGLKLGSWYQFRPYINDAQCIGIHQSDNQAWTMNSDDPDHYFSGINRKNIKLSACEDPHPTNFMQKAEVGKQAFKTDIYDLPYDANSLEQTKPFKLFTNGYSEDYQLIASQVAFDGIPIVNRIDSQIIGTPETKPLLVGTIEGIPYYKLFSESSGLCLTADSHSFWLSFKKCSLAEEGQLFSVTHIDAELGNLSREQDITPPEKINNFSIVSINRSEVKLSWSKTTDNRGGSLGYIIYDKNDMSNPIQAGIESDPSFSSNHTLDLSSKEPGTSYTYIIKAIDNNGNESEESEELTFDIPGIVELPKPAPLSLENINFDRKNVSMNLSYEQNNASSVEIYRNGNLYDTILANTFSYTDEATQPGEIYNYTYKVIYNSGNEITLMSDSLVVDLRNFAPTTPSNLQIQNQPGSDIVYISWDASVDDYDSVLIYNIYRNGILIGQSYNNYFEDYLVPYGLNTYSISATDSEDETSPLSEEIFVNIIHSPNESETSQLLPPTNFDAIFQTGHVLLSWEHLLDGTDISLKYKIYRNGLLINDTTNLLSYEDHLVPSGTYIYWIVAYTSESESERSNMIFVEVP